MSGEVEHDLYCLEESASRQLRISEVTISAEVYVLTQTHVILNEYTIKY